MFASLLFSICLVCSCAVHYACTKVLVRFCRIHTDLIRLDVSSCFDYAVWLMTLTMSIEVEAS